jgi:hypothetical protein
LDRLLPLYARDLGLELESEHSSEAVFGLGSMRIRLTELPAEPSHTPAGGGLYEIELRVGEAGAQTADKGRVALTPDLTVGARITLVAAG